jgi:hypothetical protein
MKDDIARRNIALQGADHIFLPGLGQSLMTGHSTPHIDQFCNFITQNTQILNVSG